MSKYFRSLALNISTAIFTNAFGVKYFLPRFYLFIVELFGVQARLKKNAKYRIFERKNVGDFKNVLSDQIISFTGFCLSKRCSLKLRRIRIKDPESSKYIVILTNNFE